MSQKLIDGAIKSVENALTRAVGVLNTVSNNAYKGTILEEKPLECFGLILTTLQRASSELKEKAQYEGKSDTEIAELKVQEELKQQEDYQRQLAEKLEEYAEKKKPKPDVVATDPEAPADPEVPATDPEVPEA